MSISKKQIRVWILIIIFLVIFIYLAVNKNLFVLRKNKLEILNQKSQIYLPKILDKAAPQSSAPNSPNQILIKVPFTSQAPFGVWDNLHNEACEEAALIMAEHWLNQQPLTSHQAEQEILAAVDWQIKNWGGHYDLPAERIAALGRDFFNLKNIQLVVDPTIEQIKSDLVKGNLILVPAAGRLLKNPYFRQPGPIYHVLVLRGFNGDKIITNDSGTRRGEGYRYSEQILFNAIHNWPYPGPDYGIKVAKDVQAQAILTGPKVMIVVIK